MLDHACGTCMSTFRHVTESNNSCILLYDYYYDHYYIYIYVRYAVYERFKPVIKPRPRCILLSLDDSHLQYCDLVPRSPVG